MGKDAGKIQRCFKEKELLPKPPAHITEEATPREGDCFPRAAVHETTTGNLSMQPSNEKLALPESSMPHSTSRSARDLIDEASMKGTKLRLMPTEAELPKLAESVCKVHGETVVQGCSEVKVVVSNDT